MVEIVPFETLSEAQRAAAATILREALASMTPSYQDPAEAAAEVATFFDNPERFAFAALEAGHMLGWIGVVLTYNYGWELHPVVVAPAHQRRGIGTQLVRALENAARAENVCTLYVGSDDEFGGTNASGRDLFANIAESIANIAVTQGHPIAFYRKLGFVVVGLMPDVNGPGKPDILLAKRL